jgi:polyisoprenoid-binding protein YceI
MRHGSVIVAAFALLTPVAAAAQPAEYVVDAARSAVRIHVGKSGAFSFAGHRHQVEAPVSGVIRADPASLGTSSVELRFASAGLRVRPEGEPAGDAPKVQEVMQGPKVLEVGRFPEIRFVSKAVRGQAAPGSAYDLTVVGDLTLRDVTRELTVPVRVALEGAALTATGRATLRHDQFGLKPVSAAGGTVKVANELRVEFTIVAARAAAP